MQRRHRAIKSPLDKFIRTADALFDNFRRQHNIRISAFGTEDETLKSLAQVLVNQSERLQEKIVAQAKAAVIQLGPYGLEPRAVLNLAVDASNPDTAWMAMEQWPSLKKDLLAAQIRLSATDGKDEGEFPDDDRSLSSDRGERLAEEGARETPTNPATRSIQTTPPKPKKNVMAPDQESLEGISVSGVTAKRTPSPEMDNEFRSIAEIARMYSIQDFKAINKLNTALHRWRTKGDGKYQKCFQWRDAGKRVSQGERYTYKTSSVANFVIACQQLAVNRL
ncbi:MAG: hypothetical protein IPK83_04295 [Planctomycetes bacterium]|nr:hypothetical protein [Planctomycetota bacterium]